MRLKTPQTMKSLFILLTAAFLPLGAAIAGTDPWLEQAKLVAADGANSDEFGYSVAMEGDTAVVGAWAATVDGNSNQGAAYVLVRNGETWTEQDKLIASDGTSSDGFGASVAISGDTVLVGAWSKNGAQGAVYVYVRDGESWTEQVKLIASDGGGDHRFGTSVALFGDTALVGAARAEGDGSGNGAAYVFTRDGGGVWSEEDRLVIDWPFGSSCSASACPRFGHSVALWEDTALVGAPKMWVTDDVVQSGAAYVFVREAGNWTQQEMLIRPVAASDERFGESVALWGDSALVGASEVAVDGNAGQGTAHVFTRDGGTWSEQQEFTALDGESGDNFGTSVGLLDGVALIGTPFSGLQGAGYRYTRDGGIWTEQQKLEPSDGAAEDAFGHSVALSGNTALVGAPRADIDGNSDQGAAYVFVAQEAGGPALSFTPAGLDFGTVEVGTTSAPQTATLSNTGDADATGLTFNAPDGGFDIDSSACGASLPASGDCGVSVTFTPAAAGPAGATLTADSDQGASADLALTGEGDGTGPPQLSFFPVSLDFGDVEVGTTSTPQTTTLSNTGDSDATGLTFNTPGSGFDIDTSACDATLPADGDCEVNVTFMPASLGQADDTLTAEGDDEVSASLSLTGNGTNDDPEPGILFVHPGELDFGTVEAGDTVVMTATVANNTDPGAGALTLNALDLDGGGMLDPSTSMVSLKPEGNQWGGHTELADITPDGRYVLFPGKLGTNTTAQLYRHDLWTGTVELASVNAEGDAVNISTSGYADNFSITPDGRYIAFDADGHYIRDMDAGVTESIDDIPTTDGEPPLDSSGQRPRRFSYSADFRIIAFTSKATNLVPGECTLSPLADPCIYIFDRDANIVQRVDVAYDGTPQDRGSIDPVITPDGRYVAFRSLSTNLVPDDTNGEWDVFVHDRDTGITERVSVASDGSEANGTTTTSTSGDFINITPDGRYVAFSSCASNLVPDDTNGSCALGEDGWDVFIRDRVADTTARVSVASDGSQALGGDSRTQGITPDGRYIAFLSYAGNLVPGDTNGKADHFVHDRATGITERVSVATDGTEGNNSHSFQNKPGISADGRFVTFASNATNLVPVDTNGRVDIFMRDRGGPALGTAFEITGGDCAVGTVLQPGDNCTVEITFTPPLDGVDFTGTLNVATDDEQSASVTLRGIAPQGPALAFDPLSLDFGDVPAGTTSPPKNATLTNTGDSDATGLDFTVSGGGDYFDADTTDCGNTLPADESCQVVITFTPPGEGLTFAALTAESNEEASARLNLAGKGTPGGGGLEIIFEDNFQQGDDQ